MIGNSYSSLLIGEVMDALIDFFVETNDPLKIKCFGVA